MNLSPAEWRLAPIEVRDAEAVTLKCSGHTFAECASILGFASLSGVYAAYHRAIDRMMPEEPLRKRAAKARRLEILIDGLMRVATQAMNRGDGRVAMCPPLDVVDRIVKLDERHSRLLGTDAPIKNALTDSRGNDVPINIDAGAAARIMAELTRRAAESADGDNSADAPVAAEH